MTFHFKDDEVLTNADGFKYKEFSDAASTHGWHSINSGWDCEKKWQLEKVRGVKSDFELKIQEHFDFGKLIHMMLAVYKLNYNNKGSKLDTFILSEAKRYCEKYSIDTSILYKVNDCYNSYVNDFTMKTHNYENIAVEYQIGPIKLYPEKDDFYNRTCRLDGVGMFNKDIYIEEIKTTSKGIESVISEYDMHGQISMQMLLWSKSHMIEEFGMPKGVLLDIIYRSKTGYKFQKVPIEYPMRVINNFYNSLYKKLKVLHSVKFYDTDVMMNFSHCHHCKFENLCKNGIGMSGNFVSNMYSKNEKEYKSLYRIFKEEGVNLWD